MDSTDVVPGARRGSAWLLLVVFLAGAALMSFELVGSRLLAPYFGNSIYVWGSLIGVFLSALSVGYFLGGRVADRFPTAAALALVLASSAALTAAVTVISDPVMAWVVSWNPGLRTNPLLSAVILFGPASILMGMVSPFAVRLTASDIARVGSTAGSLYGLSTVGSIVGTIGTSFWLVGSLGSNSVVILVAGTLALCALLAGGAAVGSRAFVPGVAAMAMILVMAASGAVHGTPEYSRQTSNFSPVFKEGGYREPFKLSGDPKVILSEDSSYHRIRVSESSGATLGYSGTIRVLHFDSSFQSAAPLTNGKPDLTQPPLFNYLRPFELLPAVRPEAKRALLVGLGSGTVAMRLHELAPEMEIDAVEIDPEVVDVAREHFGYDDEGDAIDTFVADGRAWLAASDKRYDIIMLDAYFADSIPFHLTTREFLEVVNDHLTDDGVVMANIIGAVRGSKSELFRSMHKTYSKRFREIAIFPTAHPGMELRLEDFGNVELLASNAELPEPGTELELLREAGLEDEVLTSEFRRIIEARYTGPIDHSGVPELTDDYAPVDSLISIDKTDQ